MSTKLGTILVVDDEEAVRALVSVVLARGGYRVLLAGDYEQALVLEQENRGNLDLLLTDISLPGKNGKELAAAVLNDRPELKVLYMSGSDRFDIFEPYGQVPPGFSFLPKPFRSQELLDQVNGLLGECAEMHALGGRRRHLS